MKVRLLPKKYHQRWKKDFASSWGIEPYTKTFKWPSQIVFIVLESTQNDRHEPCNSYCVGPIPDIDELSVEADQSQKCKRDKKKPFKVHQN